MANEMFIELAGEIPVALRHARHQPRAHRAQRGARQGDATTSSEHGNADGLEQAIQAWLVDAERDDLEARHEADEVRRMTAATRTPVAAAAAARALPVRLAVRRALLRVHDLPARPQRRAQPAQGRRPDASCGSSGSRTTASCSPTSCSGWPSLNTLVLRRHVPLLQIPMSLGRRAAAEQPALRGSATSSASRSSRRTWSGSVFVAIIFRHAARRAARAGQPGRSAFVFPFDRQRS